MVDFVYYSDSKMNNIYRDHIDKEVEFDGSADIGIAKGEIKYKERENQYLKINSYLKNEADDTGLKEYLSVTAQAKMNIIFSQSLVYWFGSYYLNHSKKSLCIFYLTGDAVHCQGYNIDTSSKKARDASMIIHVENESGNNFSERIKLIIQKCCDNDSNKTNHLYSFVAKVFNCCFIVGDEIRKLPFRKLMGENIDEVEEVRLITGSPYYVIAMNNKEIADNTYITYGKASVSEVNGCRKIVVNKAVWEKILDNQRMTEFRGKWVDTLKEKILRPFWDLYFYEAIFDIEKRIDAIDGSNALNDQEKYDRIIKINEDYYYVLKE